jgi:hypothetical protein
MVLSANTPRATADIMTSFTVLVDLSDFSGNRDFRKDDLLLCMPACTRAIILGMAQCSEIVSEGVR